MVSGTSNRGLKSTLYAKFIHTDRLLDYCSPLIRGNTSPHALKKMALENFKRIESRIRMSIVLKIGVSYQEHMILKEVEQENFRLESIEN